MLEIGNYVKVLGMKVKGDNDIYIVTNRYNNGEFCLHKVTLTGEESKTKYNILFLKEKHFNDNSLTIEVLNGKEDLKRAKKEINDYLKGITQEQKVYSFTQIDSRKIVKGSFFKVIKSISLTSSIYSVPAGTIYQCTSEGDPNGKTNYLFHRLGKRGEMLSSYNANATNKVMLAFRHSLVEQLFNEGYIVMVDRREQTKGEIEEQTKEQTEVKQEITEQLEQSEPITEQISQEQPFIKGIAYQYGINAFYNGIQAAPALDKKFLDEIIAGLKVGESSKWLAEWLEGWHDANLGKVRSGNELEPQQQEQKREEESMLGDDILGKFDNIEVNNNSRISAEDQEFCEEQEKMYSETFDMFLEFYNRTKEWRDSNKQSEYGKYIENYSSYKNSVESLQEAVFAINHNFVNQIIRHFEKNYNITIDKNIIENKLIKEFINDSNYYRSKNFKEALKKTNYNDILDQIFLQLDGFSFHDKAVKELKDKVKDKVQGRKDIEINKNKITIHNFIYPSYNYNNTECDIDTYSDYPFAVITRALSHFETGKTENIFSWLCSRLGQRQSPSNILKAHELNTNKIESIRLYKNGKFDIKFKSFEYAQQFAREYCGHIQNVA